MISCNTPQRNAIQSQSPLILAKTNLPQNETSDSGEHCEKSRCEPRPLPLPPKNSQCYLYVQKGFKIYQDAFHPRKWWFYLRWKIWKDKEPGLSQGMQKPPAVRKGTLMLKKVPSVHIRCLGRVYSAKLNRQTYAGFIPPSQTFIHHSYVTFIR